MGFEPTTPGLEVRRKLSHSLPLCRFYAHFVSKIEHPDPIACQPVTGLVTKLVTNS